MSEVKRYDPMGYDRLSGYMQQHPEGDYVRHADYAALEAECERWKYRCQYNANTAHEVAAERDALAAELAAIKGQEPVAIANKGNGVFWVKWTDAGKSLRGPGIKLYTLPATPEGGEV